MILYVQCMITLFVCFVRIFRYFNRPKSLSRHWNAANSIHVKATSNFFKAWKYAKKCFLFDILLRWSFFIKRTLNLLTTANFNHNFNLLWNQCSRPCQCQITSFIRYVTPTQSQLRRPCIKKKKSFTLRKPLLSTKWPSTLVFEQSGLRSGRSNINLEMLEQKKL